MSYTEALSRISQIQAQIAELNGGPGPAAAAGATASSPAVAAAAPTTGTPTTFASALAQAQTLPPAAASQLTSGQQQFATRLAAETGLDVRVIAAWLLAEESGGAAKSRQAANNNDWLNIGYTDSGTFGSSDSVWSNPISAADATAGWLKGQNTVPGYGPASAGIRAILSAAGQSPAAQISALQRSGWASSGYSDLPTLYQQISS